jgi:hypothetical protein
MKEEDYKGYKMSRNIHEEIKALQLTGDKYTIVECGNGCSIANLIYSVPGASALIEDTYQPYSKQAQIEWLGEIKRSVSLDTVIKAMLVVQGPCLITQLQLQGADLSVLTHGYIGVRGKYGSAIYHFSINENQGFYDEVPSLDEEVQKRSLLLSQFANIGIELMIKHSLNKNHSLKNLWIDGIFNSNHGSYMEHETLKLLGECDEVDTMIPHVKYAPLEPSGWKRMEDFMRGSEGLILMRGSFNPVHKAHIDMIEIAKKKYPTYKTAFLISLHNRDKANVDAEEAIKRADFITKLGYQVIFSSLPYFNDSSNTLAKRWDLPVIYPVGFDTINRFLEDVITTEKDIHNGIEKVVKKHGKWTSEPNSEWSVDTLENCRTAFDIFRGGDWINKKFLVFSRQGYKLSEYAKYFKDLIEIEETYTDAKAISSTKIRNGEQQNDL